MTPTEAVAEAPEQAAEKSDILTVSDRCDLCGSQAYVQVLLSTGDLNFCAHHFTKNEEKLTHIAQAVLDERYKLYQTAKLDVSAA